MIYVSLGAKTDMESEPPLSAATRHPEFGEGTALVRVTLGALDVMVVSERGLNKGQLSVAIPS